MDSIPGWLGAVGVLFMIAATLGAAVAVYRTNLQGTSLKEAERTIDRLRGEIGDYERREADLNGVVALQAAKLESEGARITILEDLIVKRKDDDEIRAEIAAVRKVVDENVVAQLTAILDALRENRGTPA